MKKWKSSRDTLTIKEIFSCFYKDYYPKELNIHVPGRQNKIDIPVILVKKIIKTFLEIYFIDLYFSGKKVLYFFLGGRMRLVAIAPILSIQHHKMTRTTIGWHWFERPCREVWLYVKLRKRTGSTNIIPKFDNRYIKENDVDMLQTAQSAKKQGIINKTNFIS